MADGTLATARLILRPPAGEDLAWVLAEMNTEAVMRHLAGVRAPDAVAESLADDIAAFHNGGHQRWTVWLRDGDTQAAERIGRVGLFHLRAAAAPPVLQGQREIGWTFAAGHWGKGYATEAARAVLDYAFGTLGLPMLYSQTSDSNAASTRMMQRLGFSRRAELDYVDPDYPPADNPTTVWSLDAPNG
ncbi:N-acetyltransferase [Porphyrobacter sp. TH134]|uniref:GNAT family N-acetyltransferase n=1 Tax=Porphyrobacter sp. TH134 TaxID=2067450 RepID=UPI000C79EB8C|nr:GNAT family N-acetyltransferase [Porphyrobacter sp. TH134]PLK25331.1 N-acetyltransferase [Porphyrobacter sp. TH134]